MVLEPMIRSLVDQLCENIHKYKNSGRPVNLTNAVASLTMDVITEYSFSTSQHCVDSDNFEGGRRMLESLKGPTEMCHVVKQFGWLLPVLKSMPVWLAKKLNPQMAGILDFEHDITVQVQRIQKEEIRGSDSHPTIFQELLNSDCDPSEKSARRLIEEGENLVAAGMLTTAHFLYTTSYLILSHSHVLEGLRKELNEAMPTPDTQLGVAKIEKLPYLAAVIKEGHRKSYGVMHRLQRIDPERVVEYNGYAIPPGTPVGMSSKIMHDDASVFPDPEKFDPERWLKPGAERLDKYLVPFSKGSRMCLGLNLANAEICLTLSSIFRRLDLELYETTWEEDVETVNDYFAASPPKSSRGVRALVK